VFDSSVVSRSESFLNDIVIDQKRGWAYISNTMGPNNQGGIITYSLSENRAMQFQGSSTEIQPDPKGKTFLINGFNYTFTSPSDTIALSNDTGMKTL
jgi:hypothetical protein